MATPRGLVQQLDQELHKNTLLPRRARLLVAVSGGADSVALLRLLHAINGSNYWNWTLIVGHVDHGIRGRASTADARFVQKLAKEMGLPFIQRKLKLGKGASEDQARQTRFDAFSRMAILKKCAGVVMAHHADDQAETILMRLMRGCGLKGLRGIEEASKILGLRIYRPLLGIRRRRLREYLEQEAQAWREDQSNADPRYLRNRVRAELMPLLETLWPKGVDAIGRMGQLAGEAQAIVETEVRRVWSKAYRGGFRKTLKNMRLSKLKRPLVVAQNVFDRQILREAGLLICGQILRQSEDGQDQSFERLREAVRLVMRPDGGKRVELGNGQQVRVLGQKVFVERFISGKREKP